MLSLCCPSLWLWWPHLPRLSGGFFLCVDRVSSRIRRACPMYKENLGILELAEASEVIRPTPNPVIQVLSSTHPEWRIRSYFFQEQAATTCFRLLYSCHATACPASHRAFPTCPRLPVTPRSPDTPTEAKAAHCLRPRLCLRPEGRSPGKTLAPYPRTNLGCPEWWSPLTHIICVIV